MCSFLFLLLSKLLLILILNTQNHFIFSFLFLRNSLKRNARKFGPCYKIIKIVLKIPFVEATLIGFLFEIKIFAVLRFITRRIKAYSLKRSRSNMNLLVHFSMRRTASTGRYRFSGTWSPGPVWKVINNAAIRSRKTERRLIIGDWHCFCVSNVLIYYNSCKFYVWKGNIRILQIISYEDSFRS